MVMTSKMIAYVIYAKSLELQRCETMVFKQSIVGLRNAVFHTFVMSYKQRITNLFATEIIHCQC